MSSQPLPIANRAAAAGWPAGSGAAGDAAETAPAAGTVAIETHGCKLNQADSSVLALQFAQAGYRLVDGKADADIIIVNTCTVTATADAKARQALRAARRANPRAVVVAAGCYPERAADELRRLPEVSLVVGNRSKPELVSLAVAALSRRPDRPAAAVASTDGRDAGEPGKAGILRRSRASVKIQEGCDQVCAYCIVPRVRGRERSIPIAELVGAVNRHVASGFKEVTLTGTQLGTYGFDLDDANLILLIRRILAETELPRLRVSSLQAHEITAELLELWGDPRLCPHFHVPLQSGCDATLAAMRRRYRTDGYRQALRLIRAAVPDAAVTTDVIVGFPGEDDGAYADSLAFVREMAFADAHVFPYSRRPGTTAHHLPDQVSPEAKRQRVAEMMATAAAGFAAFRERQIGRARPVLWETARPLPADGDADAGTPDDGAPDGAMMLWSGLTDNYVRATTASALELGNRITSARLLRTEGKAMVAQVAGQD